MTYFGFLFLFLGIPLLLFAILNWRDGRRGREVNPTLHGIRPWIAILGLVVVAVLYTTPWDNYLVATKVWWYDPALVTGLTIGWVPIEEYTFFVLQTILTSLWLLWLARRVYPARPFAADARLRWGGTLVVGAVWLVSIYLLVSNLGPGTYLGLELVWALPPIMLQLAFGADILWHYRRLVLLTLLPVTLFLAAADALAITSGTWTINPEQSMNIFIGGLLPIEELIFFLLTNTLVVFGLTLALAQESAERFSALRHFNKRNKLDSVEEIA